MLLSKRESYLTFNIKQIKQLKEDYESTLKLIRTDLPNINFNSKKEVTNFFWNTFQISLQSSKINEIAQTIHKFKEDTPEYETVLGIIYYLKIKYMIKNYIDCILRHEKAGRIELRDYFGLAMPNRRELPYALEVINCVIDGSPDAMSIITRNKESLYESE